ncbi:hypothetical protein DICPUDRAFT_91346 [Dictyostelium purpureum]|uniref:Peptide-methionine (R)-S-oxide reductase n=1 Tax=Dictyostelium purpureum TaxID=5786 RepID=F0ZB06_DICPU|nr:uncharacterized protein DICPUDRAFT_91346 [Dictyostelium purpureum]EGC38922.1 hypothetical protein DICPUDRAFT_91346 [Dictyostelium purpureum]|eukprot:XP_003284602.1 hypothetical protein DICPUDRAFT_91346 [Dictyostelium purpureum]
MSDLNEQEWRVKLSPEQFRVLREKGTEAPFVGKYTDNKDEGLYECAGCGTPLFKSTQKFHSGCGWPSFFDSLPDAITFHSDPSIPGRPRTEICCKKCGGHLGHVFKGEGFNTPIDQRHCVNSISLNFKPSKQ